ncbi:MAG: hypothetical protein AAB429_03215 [Patescibacteria group bacterium]
MASTNYRIDWDTISNGGLDTSSSASYQLRDTIGNPAIGDSSSSSYNLAAGYRGGVEDQVLTFTLLPQAASVEQVATVLSGNIVTVVSTTDFEVDDYAIVVQDIGTDQVTGFGKITAKTSTTLTFDDLADNGTAPVVDGSNDRVYLLEGADISFSTLSSSEVVTEIVGFEVTAASDNGYSVQIADDGNLRSGSSDVDDVSDGGVSVGSEEYGGRSSDTSLASSTFDTADSALTTSLQPVVTEASAAFDDRHFFTLKAAVSNSTAGGTYTQVLTVVATGNY